MRVFFATGEPSGDMLAATLAEAIREFAPDARFRGIGGERMRAAGIEIVTPTAGWASMGPLAALRLIPKLLFDAFRQTLRLRLAPVDLVVLVDFGAYNLRLARLLRWSGYTGRVLYYFPPGAWLDSPSKARVVAENAIPLTAFAHQRDFYASLGLDCAWFGHPLCSLVEPRAARPPAPPRGGTVALLPGSRRGEIAFHLPPLLAACALVRARRPEATFVVSAADAYVERFISAELARAGVRMRIVRGTSAAFETADAAWIASGTAVLEATLREVPTVALYVISAAQARIARRVWLDRHPFVTLPNILLGREMIRERLQEAATPQNLADDVEELLRAPECRIAEMRAFRALLGPPDALRRCAAFATVLARHP